MLSAFLIFPALFVLQSVVSDSFGKSARSTIAFAIITVAILLAFSRAAWAGVRHDLGVHVDPDDPDRSVQAQRSRIMLTSIAPSSSCWGWFSHCPHWTRSAKCSSSAPASIKAMMKVVSAASAGISRGPNGARPTVGIGPLQFHRFFPEDTHNSFLNAFMSGGWLAGFAIHRWCSSP